MSDPDDNDHKPVHQTAPQAEPDSTDAAVAPTSDDPQAVEAGAETDADAGEDNGAAMPVEDAASTTPDTRRPPVAAAPSKGGDRIAKIMARAGVASRRDAERMITEGRVRVNGTVIRSPALDVLPSDRVVIDGQPMDAPQETRLWLYYKPVGLVTSEADEKGRQTVFDALPRDLPRVMTIGRLDLNSEGLLLLTNDGALKRRLELPSTGWMRRYRVRVNGQPNQLTFEPLRRGAVIDGEQFQPMEIEFDTQQGANAWLTVGIREGKNREIRRAMNHIGLFVNRLIRISYGPFRLTGLEKNEVREVKRRMMRDQLGGLLTGEAAPDAAEEARPERRPRRSGNDRTDRTDRTDSGPRAPRAVTPTEAGSSRNPRAGWGPAARGPRGEGSGPARGKPHGAERPRDSGPASGRDRGERGQREGGERERSAGSGARIWDSRPPRAGAGATSDRPRAAHDGPTGRHAGSGDDRKPRAPRTPRPDDRTPWAARGGDKAARPPRVTGEASTGARPDRKPWAKPQDGAPSAKPPGRRDGAPGTSGTGGRPAREAQAARPAQGQGKPFARPSFDKAPRSDGRPSGGSGKPASGYARNAEGSGRAHPGPAGPKPPSRFGAKPGPKSGSRPDSRSDSRPGGRPGGRPGAPGGGNAPRPGGSGGKPPRKPGGGAGRNG